MAENAIKNQPSLYERDFHAWAREQARVLAERRTLEVDWANVAEELDDLGKSKQREIRNRLKVLLLHLLKWQVQPEGRKGGWAATIREQRQEIADVIDDNPSLHGEPAARIGWAYARARGLASDETGLAPDAFPATCPYGVAQVLDEDWLPDAEGP